MFATVSIIVWQHSTISKILLLIPVLTFSCDDSSLKISKPWMSEEEAGISSSVYVQREATKSRQWVKKKMFSYVIIWHKYLRPQAPVNLYLLIVKSPSYLCQGNIRTSVWESHYLLLSSPGSVWTLGKNHCYLYLSWLVLDLFTEV